MLRHFVSFVLSLTAVCDGAPRLLPQPRSGCAFARALVAEISLLIGCVQVVLVAIALPSRAVVLFARLVAVCARV